MIQRVINRINKGMVLLILLSSFLFISQSNAFAKTIFSDNFTDNDGTGLLAHSNIWGKSFGELSDLIILNNELMIPGGNNTSYYLNGFFKQKDQCASLDAEFPLSSFVSLFIRRNNNRTAYYNYRVGPGTEYSVTLYSQNGILYQEGYPPLSGVHNLKICAIRDNVVTYLDGKENMNIINIENASGTAEFGTGNVGESGLDNFLYTDGLEDTSNDISLLVPSIKQTDSFWRSQIYDSAKKWSPKDPAIGSWGCALTSAAMILNYYNIVKLPDTSFITPGTLNKWLIKQKDGYIGNGLVNWLAISRLTKLAKESGYNPNFPHDALEYERSGANDSIQLTSDLIAKRPDILEEPGHFIVAKGTQASTFLINDPYYAYSTLEEGYGNSFSSINRYIPSNTDLSYFLIVGSKNQDLSLLDENNNSISNSFAQNPMQNDNNLPQKSGGIISELLFKHPQSKNYSLIASGKTISLYSFDIYLYDKNGNPIIKTISGISDHNAPDNFFITYNHDDSKLSTIKKNVSFDSIIKEIENAILLRKIDKTFGNTLISSLKIAQGALFENKSLSKTILKADQILVKTAKVILVSKEASTIINSDLELLIKST